MNFIDADNLSVGIFIVFSIVMYGLCIKALKTTSSWRLWTLVLSFVVLVFLGAALSGLVAEQFLPLGPILFLSLFLVGILFSSSTSGKELEASFSIATLIGFQGFRLPLELILHHWASLGTIPETMTWSGQNWDIVTGIVSLLALPLIRKNKSAALAVNILGFILLLNVIRVVILSSPLPFSWPLERPLLLVAYAPYCLIGPLFVLPAMVVHLLAFRKIFMLKE